jgi:ketosteroid isomerase-like protein
MRARFVHIWTVTNGLVSRYRQLADSHTFRSALGR